MIADVDLARLPLQAKRAAVLMNRLLEQPRDIAGACSQIVDLGGRGHVDTAQEIEPGPQPLVAPYESSLRPLSHCSSSVVIMSPKAAQACLPIQPQPVPFSRRWFTWKFHRVWSLSQVPFP